MDAATSVDELFATQIRPLPVADRLRLLALLAQDVASNMIPELQELDEEQSNLTIDEHLARANYHGGALFKTAEEVDAYIRAERDSWER
jgi:hypothetical protein